MKSMNILVTADASYAEPVRTMLHSLFANNPGETFAVFHMHPEGEGGHLAAMASFCREYGSVLTPVPVPAGLFSNAPVRSYYTEAMYYRLLAHEFLPENVTRILYLDPDTLVINPVRDLYGTELHGHAFAAASHSGLTNIIKPINALRLGIRLPKAYFNSGVLLIDVATVRRETSARDILDTIEQHRENLLLPDQDILNILFGDAILLLEDVLYNYDARRYETYYIASGGKADMDWVLRNTVILHYCGGKKPWHPGAKGRFADVYKKYQRLARQPELSPEPAVMAAAAQIGTPAM